MSGKLQATTNCKHIAIARFIAGAPLLLFGIMHLTGAMPMKPLLEAAALPAPGPTAILAPLMQITAGALLLSGAFARIGGGIAILTMLGAIVTHIKIPNDQWPNPEGGVMDEPVAMMAIAAIVILTAAYVTVKGAGAWSFDNKTATPKSPTSTPA